MNAAYQAGQSSSRSPVRFSCSPCAVSARLSARASWSTEVNVAPSASTRPGSRLVISCSCQTFPSGSRNSANDAYVRRSGSGPFARTLSVKRLYPPVASWKTPASTPCAARSCVRGLDVGHDEQVDGRPRCSRREPGAELDRAPRTRRVALDDPEVAGSEVGVEPPSEVLVEGLRGVDVRNGDDGGLERQVDVHDARIGRRVAGDLGGAHGHVSSWCRRPKVAPLRDQVKPDDVDHGRGPPHAFRGYPVQVTQLSCAA